MASVGIHHLNNDLSAIIKSIVFFSPINRFIVHTQRVIQIFNLSQSSPIYTWPDFGSNARKREISNFFFFFSGGGGETILRCS